MTAKERAKELVNIFFQYTQRRADAKMCAVSCVDEILQEVDTITSDEREYLNEFYTDVLKELNKL